MAPAVTTITRTGMVGMRRRSRVLPGLAGVAATTAHLLVMRGQASAEDRYLHDVKPWPWR